MIGFYNYTVIATYLSMLVSLAGIYACAAGSPVAGVFCLMLSGLLDCCDGTIAGTKKDRTPQERRFGIQIDSLSDLICFGLLPCAILYYSGLNALLNITVYLLFTLCALIRLAFYNVSEEERQDQTADRRKHYSGLPVTTVSYFLPLLYLSSAISDGAFRWVCTLGLLAAALLFITPFKLRKPAPKLVVALVVFFVAEAAALTVLL